MGREYRCSRIWAHDETPQFINFNASGQSKKKVFAGTGDDCAELAKENCCVTVQPFSNFAWELAMVQVIFSGACITSHMCPASAAEKIQNLLISVNQSGTTDLYASKCFSSHFLLTIVQIRDIAINF